MVIALPASANPDWMGIDPTLPQATPLQWNDDLPNLPPAPPQNKDDEVTLKAGIIKTLPEELYGTWNIIATVIRYDGPNYAPIQRVNSELWALGETHSEISIENVVNGAYASISVDEVKGRTATFRHKTGAVENGLVVEEIPTVTVSGNHLSGINRQIRTYYRWGQAIRTIHIDFEITGERLKGTGYQVKAPIRRNSQGKPLFEVQPMQKDFSSPFLDN